MNTKTYRYKENFQLESGKVLQNLELSYTTLGTLNFKKNNVIWVTHALTANSNPKDWWAGLVGEGKLFNPEKHFIVCVNILGSCYGSTGPLSFNKVAKSNYYHDFPEITIRDIVKGLDLVRQELGIIKIHTLIGGSLGGQQALEWAIQQPELVDNLFLIATNAEHSPWGKAFNESQRMAIKSDCSWLSYSKNAGMEGLKVARSIALLSYRNYNTYSITQQDSDNRTDNFKASSYQNYQGKKLASRFNAFSYWYLSKAMDSHNIARSRGGIENALSRIQSKTLIVAVGSDILFPVSESKRLQLGIRNSELEIIESLYGHDGFLIETEQLDKVIRKFYKRTEVKNQKTNCDK